MEQFFISLENHVIAATLVAVFIFICLVIICEGFSNKTEY